MKLEDFREVLIEYDLKKKIEKLKINESYKYLCMLFMSKLNYKYTQLAKQKADVRFISYSIESLQVIFGYNKITYTCIRALEQAKLIERGTSYLVGEYSKGFKPVFISKDEMITVKSLDYMSTRQMENLRNRVIKFVNENIKGAEWHLMNLIENVELDLFKLKILIFTNFNVELKLNENDTKEQQREKIIEQIKALKTDEEFIKAHLKEIGYKRVRKERIEKEICNRKFLQLKVLELLNLKSTTITIGEKGGRHFHALSNTPRLLRACIVSKDPKKPYLMQIDIKNSQPFFLLCLFEKHGLRIEEGLRLAIIGGKFYEDIGACWGYNRYDITNDHETRQGIKEKVYSNILFADDHIRKTSDYFKKVKARYPMFAQAIFDLTQDGGTLASLLQRLEADEVLPVVKKFKAIGLHDAIITIAVDELDRVQEIEKELLSRFEKKYKLIPSVSVDKISEREK